MAEPETMFEKLADRVSFGMGTPTNILVWLSVVAVWFVLGVAVPKLWTTSQFLPAWFVSTSWNFPLNTVTTLAELYIGFLVAAAANRNERTSRALAQTQSDMLAAIKSEDDELIGEGKSLAQLMAENTELTKQVKVNTDLLEEIHRHLSSAG